MTGEPLPLKPEGGLSSGCDAPHDTGDTLEQILADAARRHNRELNRLLHPNGREETAERLDKLAGL